MKYLPLWDNFLGGGLLLSASSAPGCPIEVISDKKTWKKILLTRRISDKNQGHEGQLHQLALGLSLSSAKADSLAHLLSYSALLDTLHVCVCQYPLTSGSGFVSHSVYMDRRISFV